MKISSFIVLKKNDTRRSASPVAAVLVTAVALLIGDQSFADESGYRVVLGDVPGADEIQAGNVHAGIEMLEHQLNHVEQGNGGDVWSTLCAAYIINLSLVKAEHACNKAVDTNPTYHALNNRGVFRVYKSDLSGAREDFERVRPLHVGVYLERLKTTNVRLIAAGNSDLLNQLLATRSRSEAKTWHGLSAAKIEDLND